MPYINSAELDHWVILSHYFLPELREVPGILVGGIEDLDQPELSALFNEVAMVIGGEGW
jgi:hypothetical protein